MSHMKRSRRKSEKKRNKASLLLASLFLILTVGVAGTVSYLITQTDSVTNTFIAGTVTPVVEETFDGTTKSNVSIINDGNVGAYVRAAVIINWVDADGNIIPGPDVEGDGYSLNLGNGWVKSGEFCYWPGVVEANGKTGILINSCTQDSNVPTGYYLSVEIVAQTIQAEPSDAVIDAWGSDAAALVGAVSTN